MPHQEESRPKHQLPIEKSTSSAGTTTRASGWRLDRPLQCSLQAGPSVPRVKSLWSYNLHNAHFRGTPSQQPLGLQCSLVTP